MIRKALYSDIDQINELGEELHKNFSKLFNISQMLEDKITKIFVYVINEKVVGFIIATCLYENVDILSIIVDKKYRRKHIATNLIDFLIDEVRNSCEIITLEVAIDNKPAIFLYKKFGFEVINVRKGYYHGIDAYLMGRKNKV